MATLSDDWHGSCIPPVRWIRSSGNVSPETKNNHSREDMVS